MEKETIDEYIADAIAEEQVKREQQKLKTFNDVYKPHEASVTIPLSEYVVLNYMARDLELLKSTIENAFTLSYNKAEAFLSDRDKIEQVYKILYREDYNEILKKLQAEEEGE